MIGRETYPGFRRPEPTDYIAVLLAESRGGVPHLWFQKVIEGNYDAGLRFFAIGFDLGDLAYSDGEVGRCAIFYSSDDAEHFAALTKEPELRLDTVDRSGDAEEHPYHVDESAENRTPIGGRKQ